MGGNTGKRTGQRRKQANKREAVGFHVICDYADGEHISWVPCNPKEFQESSSEAAREIMGVIRRHGFGGMEQILSVNLFWDKEGKGVAVGSGIGVGVGVGIGVGLGAIIAAAWISPSLCCTAASTAACKSSVGAG